MRTQLKISIPIRPHLKKYFLKKYKTIEPISLNKKTILGKMIIHGFSRLNNPPKNIDGFKQQLEVLFDHDLDLIFSKGNVYDFNDLLEDLYRTDLAFFVGREKLFDFRAEKKLAIEVFNDGFGISEDDISIETLQKHLQRHPRDMNMFDFQQLKKVS